MQIFVKAARTTALEVEENSTVEQVKALFAQTEGIPAEDQRLVFAGKFYFYLSIDFSSKPLFAGKQLCDDSTLAQCGIEKEATLHLSLRLLGGNLFHNYATVGYLALFLL